MGDPARVLSQEQTVRGDFTLTRPRAILVYAHQLAAIDVLSSALAQGIGQLVPSTTRKDINSRLFVHAASALSHTPRAPILRIKLGLASIQCMHGLVIG